VLDHFGNYSEFIEMKELVATNSFFRAIPSIRLNVDLKKEDEKP
jgi:hypothetical protein